jgi:hypothetical protein
MAIGFMDLVKFSIPAERLEDIKGDMRELIADGKEMGIDIQILLFSFAYGW